jgi:signal recognition particle subunit SRP19
VRWSRVVDSNADATCASFDGDRRDRKDPYVGGFSVARMVENVIWPAALDATCTRSEGRRVSTDLAVPEPTVDEIAQAVQQVGYDAVIERDKTYPREYEPRGRVLVKDADDASKSDLLGAVAAYLGVIRE